MDSGAIESENAVPWADPIAALALIPLIVHEGYAAMEFEGAPKRG